MTSQRISDLVVVGTFENTDYFNIIRNNTNLKIPFSAVAPALGAIGTINSVGGVGTPILEQPDATTNNIRILEDGAGVRASISAQNGITLDNNFNQDNTGVEIVDNLTDTSPTFPSLLAGAGMQINRLGDVITFTATGDPLPATKTVAVNSLSDFPADVAGVITLEDDTVYVISNDVTSPHRFETGVRTTITGWSPLGPLLTYTGTGTMFTGTDDSTVFTDLRVSCPLAKVFTFTKTGVPTNIVSINNVSVAGCDTIGTFNDKTSVVISGLSAIGVTTTGINFTGTGSAISITDLTVVTASATFIGVDFGTSVYDSISIERLLITGPAGAIGIKGAAGDANLSSVGFASVSNSNFIGALTPLSGIVVADDVQWQFTNNQGIEDTMADSLLSMQANATETVIASAGVGVLLAGTWVVEQEAQVTSTTAGRITYNGKKDLRTPVTVSVTIAPVSGGAQTMGVMIAFNGVVIANSLKTASASSGTPTSITLPWQVTLSEGDYVEAFVSNESGTTNVLASVNILRLN